MLGEVAAAPRESQWVVNTINLPLERLQSDWEPPATSEVVSRPIIQCLQWRGSASPVSAETGSPPSYSNNTGKTLYFIPYAPDENWIYFLYIYWCILDCTTCYVHNKYMSEQELRSTMPSLLLQRLKLFPLRPQCTVVRKRDWGYHFWFFDCFLLNLPQNGWVGAGQPCGGPGGGAGQGKVGPAGRDPGQAIVKARTGVSVARRYGPNHCGGGSGPGMGQTCLIFLPLN